MALVLARFTSPIGARFKGATGVGSRPTQVAISRTHVAQMASASDEVMMAELGLTTRRIRQRRMLAQPSHEPGPAEL
jgi:hypothetical protein